ncbi:MAG: VTT domain-containing protein [Spirochaetes bacterium]|nr:VTT domain-containing protein [Spirochaetota bacterium]
MKIKEKLKKHLPKIIFISIIVLIIIIYYSLNLKRYFDLKHITDEKLTSIKNFFAEFYFIGPIIIILFFMVFNISMLPTFFFIFISGYLYGPFYGSFLGYSGMIFGMAASFLTIRYLFKKDFNFKFGNTKTVKAIESYIEKYHGLAVLFFRLFFIFPYNIQNIAYGLSRIKTSTYIFFSAIGIIPSTLMWIFLGYFTSKNAIALADVKKFFLLSVIIIAALLLFFVLTFFIKKKLNITINK